MSDIGDRFVGPDGVVVTYLGANPHGVVMAQWDEVDEPWIIDAAEWERDWRPAAPAPIPQERKDRP